MPTMIAVTGRAEARIAPELGAVGLSIGAQGARRDDVTTNASAVHERVLAAIRELEASGALDTWSAGQVRVWSYRPWNNEGRQLPLVHQASAELEVVFRDLARLADWVGEVSVVDEVAIGGIEWKLTDASRRRMQESAQRSAVADAVARARVYASALGLGEPVPVELADHGMLSTRPEARDERMLMVQAAAEMGGGGPSTELAPADLVIEAAVDARFSADVA